MPSAEELDEESARWRALLAACDRLEHELGVVAAVPRAVRARLNPDLVEAIEHLEDLRPMVSAACNVVRVLERHK